MQLEELLGTPIGVWNNASPQTRWRMLARSWSCLYEGKFGPDDPSEFNAYRQTIERALYIASGELLLETIASGSVPELQHVLTWFQSPSAVDEGEPAKSPDGAFDLLVRSMRYPDDRSAQYAEGQASEWMQLRLMNHGVSRFPYQELLVPAGTDLSTAPAFLVSDASPDRPTREVQEKPVNPTHLDWLVRNDAGQSYDKIAFTDKVEKDTVARAIQRLKRRRDRGELPSCSPQ